MAERFENDKPVVEKTTVVTREGAENGAREYKAPEKKAGFPWWLLPLALIPLLIFAFSRRDNDETSQASSAAMSPAAMSSPMASPSPMASASPIAVTSPAPDMSAADAMDRAARTEGASGSMIGAGMADSDSSGTAPDGRDIKVYKGNDIAVTRKGAASMAGEPLSDVAELTSVADKTTLIDRNVSLKNVSVVSVINNRAFYVGPSASQEILVMLGPDMKATGKTPVVIEAGNKISVTGILKALPEQSMLQSDYQISANQYSNLQNESVYLHATIAQEK